MKGLLRLSVIAFFNPKTLHGVQSSHRRVKVVTATNTLPNHFWIGVTEPGIKKAGRDGW